MALIKSPCLFFTTSPRTPFKMRPEIRLLVEQFRGLRWEGNSALQADFMRKLAASDGFEGSLNQNDPALSARDRITRGPKALGFVDLSKIGLTAAGECFLDEDLSEETLLRQLMKFQLPSPFHRVAKGVHSTFCVKPYLEILRLIRRIGKLSFDELMLFGMQLTDYHEFEKVIQKIKVFRKGKVDAKGRYRKYLQEAKEKVVTDLFSWEIAHGKIKTRESNGASLAKFVDTKASNLRDYADACLRYLRATGVVTISNPGKSISVIDSRVCDVDYLLNTLDRSPVFVSDERKYKEYLYDDTFPRLYTDDRSNLERLAIDVRAVKTSKDARECSIYGLKKAIRKAQETAKTEAVEKIVGELKTYSKYDEVMSTFDAIKNKTVYDAPLTLEWNTWRAMTMLDGGNIKANLHFDAAGNPLSTAPGNGPDIVCDYEDFFVSVEVTMMSGQKQYDSEAEPVARHLGKLKSECGKPTYCLFVSPTINPAAVTHFYVLHKVCTAGYGGCATIIPITLDRFVGMVAQSKAFSTVPRPDRLRAFCEYSIEKAKTATDENDWYLAVCDRADRWLEPCGDVKCAC